MAELARADNYLLSVSIVSHGQMSMVMALLSDMQRHCATTPLEVLLTINIAEAEIEAPLDFGFPIQVLVNDHPLGFGANHNQAFQRSKGSYFCVLNPDIRLQADPFEPLLATLADGRIGIAAPCVVNPAGQQEDSARRFPSPWAIALKALGLGRGNPIAVGDAPIYPDWAAGMFLLLPRSVYVALGGFDRRYFLYYEDVDLCARARLAGYQVIVTPKAQVVHAGQRASHRSVRYLRWHINSMLRFFCSAAYWKVLIARKASAP